MKKLLLIILITAGFIMTACSEEESHLSFKEENISNPDNVKMKHYSPDPSCVAKMYRIEANSSASEITLKCTNASTIFIEKYEGNLSEEFICLNGLWKAVIVNSNSITFTFEELDGFTADEYPLNYVGFNVVSQTKKGMVRSSISVLRWNDPQIP